LRALEQAQASSSVTSRTDDRLLDTHLINAVTGEVAHGTDTTVR